VLERPNARALDAETPRLELSQHPRGVSLDEFNVPKPEQDELLAFLAPMRDDIVEVESPKTGTPLPDAYRPAPALT
jgi:hypothetical protein